MDVLKKVKAATLIETLTASVLIVIVLMVASLILNTIFSNTVKNNRDGIHSRIDEIVYLVKNEKIKLPYYEDFENWEIALTSEPDNIQVRYTRDTVAEVKILSKEHFAEIDPNQVGL